MEGKGGRLWVSERMRMRVFDVVGGGGGGIVVLEGAGGGDEGGWGGRGRISLGFEVEVTRMRFVVVSYIAGWSFEMAFLLAITK